MTNSAQSTTFNYFVGSGLVLTDGSKTTADLVPLQLGIFNSKNYKALSSATANAKAVPEIIVAMGSPNAEKISWTNASMSFKSVPIQASKLIAWRKSSPKKPAQHKVVIGWDGTTDCKTIDAECDKTYTLHLQLEGSPTTRFFGAKPLTETFVYHTPCCTDCVSGCTADVEAMVDEYINQINVHPRISPFVKAEKLVTYSAAPTTETVAYESYTLTIADEGLVQDLAKIQATYPNAVVTRSKREGIYSAYTLVQIASEGAPSAYSNEANVVISNCTDCPSGYTLVPAYDKFKVEYLDEGVDETSAIEGFSADFVKVTKINTGASTGTYIIEATAGEFTSPEAVATKIADEGSGSVPVVTSLGATASYCVLTSATTIAWVAGDAYYKEVRELCLVLGDESCDDVSGTSQLAAIVDFYSGNEYVVADSIAQADNGTCANTYTLKQVSENLLKESECATGIATFKALDAYKGKTWEACCDAESTKGTVDKIGIVLTGAYIDTQFGKCSFKYDDFVELDMVRIIVRQGDYVELEDKCATRWAVTELQKPVYPTGVGTNVLKEYIAIQQTKGQRWSDDPRWREIYGYNYDFIKNDKYYKHYYLEFEALDKFNTSTGFGGNDFKQTIVFAFEEDTDTSAFETLIESWINSARPDLVSADTQENLYR